MGRINFQPENFNQVERYITDELQKIDQIFSILYSCLFHMKQNTGLTLNLYLNTWHTRKAAINECQKILNKYAHLYTESQIEANILQKRIDDSYKKVSFPESSDIMGLEEIWSNMKTFKIDDLYGKI